MFPKAEVGLEVLLEALVTGDSDAAIRNQEKRGQGEFVRGEVLPKDCLRCTRDQFEKMGIVYGGDADDLFVYVMLPQGWKKEPTDHSMWSKLVDERGRERAAIFYKAAFYDRSAHISLTRRFTYSNQPVAGWGSKNIDHEPWCCVVTDCGVEIWRSPELEPEPDIDDNRPAWMAWYDKKNALAKTGKAWLLEHYPDFENPLAYWD
jgi:hypothetical protein